MTDKGGREVTSKVGVRGARLEKYRKKEGLADEESTGCLKEGFWKYQISQQHAFRINPPPSIDRHRDQHATQ